MKLNKRAVLLAVFFLLFGVLIVVIASTGAKKHDKKVIGFIMTGSINESGWNGMHYKGVYEACQKLGTEIIVKENLKEFSGECAKAISDLIKKGCKMIILSSYGYPEEVQDVIEAHPEIAFYCNSFNMHEPNMTSYFTRMYQARYFAGIVAGMKTENNKIGYVAAMKNSEVNRGINAFALGVRRVNPEATVTVVWSGDWDNESAEKRKAGQLIYEIGTDVITYHQNQSYVVETAEEAGIYSIGYHQKPDSHSEKYLATTACDWSLTYQAIIKQFLQGKSFESDAYWIGIEEDENAVLLRDISPLLDEEIKQEIEKARNEMLAGKDVFSDVIYDNQGNQQCKENERISDRVILEHMDWLVEGVEAY